MIDKCIDSGISEITNWLEEKTDEQLCHLFRNGNVHAEEVLVKRHNKLVKVCSRSYFLVGADSDDLIQEGMLGLMSAIRHYDSTREAKFVTFAKLCITRSIFTAVKKASSNKHIPLNSYVSIDPDNNNSLDLSGIFTDTNDPEHIIISREEIKENTERLTSLLSKFEASVLKFYLQGVAINEIATRLNKSEKSIDNALQRIKRKGIEGFSLGL